MSGKIRGSSHFSAQATTLSQAAAQGEPGVQSGSRAGTGSSAQSSGSRRIPSGRGGSSTGDPPPPPPPQDESAHRARSRAFTGGDELSIRKATKPTIVRAN